MADALADLSDPDVLGVPSDLLSASANVSAAAWDRYRLVLTHSLHRAFAAGVDWQRALRAMDLIYSDPEIGHPRISQYVQSAMTDRVLVGHPLLHAEVLRFKMDKSFAAGSSLYSKDSRTADWERSTTRLPGEDVVTLATRITEAYLKKAGDPKLDAVTVWASNSSARDISERFGECLLADPVNPARGSRTKYEYDTYAGMIEDRIQRGVAHPSERNIVDIAAAQLQAHETAAAGKLYDLSDIDDGASVSSDSNRPATSHPVAGGRRTRRSQRHRGHPPTPGANVLLLTGAAQSQLAPPPC